MSAFRGRTVDEHRAARTCTACGTAPRMRDWSAVPADGVGVARDLETGTPLFCADCWTAHYRDPRRLAESQTRAAIESTQRPREALVRWPFAALDALTGPMAPGTVHYVGAASGSGKTTFSTSVISRWVAAGVRVDVMPLEIESWEWRKQLAAIEAGVPVGDVMSGELEWRASAPTPEEAERESEADAARREDAHRQLDRVRDFLRTMRKAARDDGRLAVHPDRAITARRLREIARVAAARGAQVIVVDHIDHIDGDDTGAKADALSESKRVNRTVLDVAQEFGLVAVALSQLNAARFAGSRDRLAKYAPPQTRDLYLHTYKEHVGNTILGLFRPVQPGADPDTIARARSGEIEPVDVLAPGVMGVALLKSRPYGSREGKRAYLTVDRGAARDRTLDEARDWEGASSGIRTGDGAGVLPLRRRNDRGAA